VTRINRRLSNNLPMLLFTPVCPQFCKNIILKLNFGNCFHVLHTQTKPTGGSRLVKKTVRFVKVTSLFYKGRTCLVKTVLSMTVGRKWQKTPINTPLQPMMAPWQAPLHKFHMEAVIKPVMASI